MTGEKAGKPLLLTNVKPMAFGSDTAAGIIDILIGADGKIAAFGPQLAAPGDIERVDGKGAWISPGALLGFGGWKKLLNSRSASCSPPRRQ